MEFGDDNDEMRDNATINKETLPDVGAAIEEGIEVDRQSMIANEALKEASDKPVEVVSKEASIEPVEAGETAIRLYLPRKSKSHAELMLKNIAKGIITANIVTKAKGIVRKRFVRRRKIPNDSFRVITKKSCSGCCHCSYYKSTKY